MTSLDPNHAQAKPEPFTDLPPDYLSWTARQKQDFLWQERILKTQYDELPPLKRIDVLGLFLTRLRSKMDYLSDEAPPDWRKAIHAHASVAKVEWIPADNPPFTGLFRGANHGLLRLSVTADPSDRGFAPGLAMKWLMDGVASQDVSALVSLIGQGKNYNYFANEFSNIVPVVNQVGPKLINLIFMRVSRYPTKLSLQKLGERDQQGNTVVQPHAPTQLFLVPNPALQFSESAGRDFRNDLASIAPGTVLFSVYGTDATSDRAKATAMGQIKTTSAFIASSYGDHRLFFRHQHFGK